MQTNRLFNPVYICIYPTIRNKVLKHYLKENAFNNQISDIKKKGKHAGGQNEIQEIAYS